MQISAVIITFNEEKNIGRCLQSLKDIADEIIVVDSFSTDKTEEICNEYGVNFVKQDFQGFVKQKNDVIALASFDFIFSIDADEVVSSELKKSILAIKQKNENNAYIINRLTNYCGKWIRHCSWYPDYIIRIFNRKEGSFQGNYIHEKVVLNNSNSIEVVKLQGDLYHYSYYSISEHIIRANKYTDLTALEAFEKGENVSLFKIWFNPKFKFFRNYILKLGFLDGYYGYTVCRISAFATYLKYSKLRALQKQHKNE